MTGAALSEHERAAIARLGSLYDNAVRAGFVDGARLTEAGARRVVDAMRGGSSLAVESAYSGSRTSYRVEGDEVVEDTTERSYDAGCEEHTSRAPVQKWEANLLEKSVLQKGVAMEAVEKGLLE